MIDHNNPDPYWPESMGKCDDRFECKWNDTSATCEENDEMDCWNIYDPPFCEKMGCFWDYGFQYCMDPSGTSSSGGVGANCADYDGNTDGCYEHGCTYVNGTDLCESCNNFDLGSCTSTMGCTVIDTTCESCAFLDQTECGIENDGGIGMCLWHEGPSVCGPNMAPPS